MVDGGTIAQFKFTDFDPIVFKCNDIMDACRSLYGFCLGNDHCYFSMFYDGQLLRFKFSLPININLITNIPQQHTYVTDGELGELIKYKPISEYKLGQIYARYPIYIQYTELKDNLSRLLSVDK